MTRFSGRNLTMGVGAAVLASGSIWCATTGGQETKSLDPRALEHARHIVQVADNMHKAYVIHVTGTYVKAQEQTPAARVARKVYQHMEANNFFSGRLVDASEKPISLDNVAKTDFEKKSVAAIQKGAKYYEEVGTKDGQPVLRAATIVPAVMKQCVACHTQAKEGDLLGVLTYEVPIK